MTARLLQVHGVILDLIYQVEAVPAPGTEAQVRGFALSPGGGFNAMVAARRSGMAVGYAGALGTGPFSEVAKAALVEEGITVLRPRDPDRDQGCCTVMVDRLGERTFVASAGAEGHVSGRDLQHLDVSGYGWALVSGYTLSYEGAREALSQWLLGGAGVPNLVFDPSPVVEAVPDTAIQAALARATWVSANASEAERLTGFADPQQAAHHLAETRAGAVVRMGADGCIVAWQGQARHVPGLPVTVVDTNGAGDCHVGAFIAALARGQTPYQAALCANTAAALSTTQPGPATAPDLKTIEDTLRLQKAG